MKKRLLIAIVCVAVFGVVGFTVRASIKKGLSTRETPSLPEAMVARRVRRWAIPASATNLKNPVPVTPEMLQHGLEHWADHCATCHANDGSGKTTIGMNLYPKAPDMRGQDTQSLSDGELYYIIRNGVRMTGMPAWGKPEEGEHDHETWMLVLFIRHLPQLTTEELQTMTNLNPKSPSEMEEERREEEFLSGIESVKHKASH